MRRLGIPMVAVSAVLLLVTIPMALFYAPIPQTSVSAAGEILSSIDGYEIQVAGFVTSYSVEVPNGLGRPNEHSFLLADFVDYERYEAALSQDRLSETWWTVEPIKVTFSSGQLFGSPPAGVANGTNVSASGTVLLGPEGYVLRTDGQHIDVGTSSAQFEIMSAPLAQKIFYFHMPSAWVSYLAFFVTLVFAAMYLKTRRLTFDRIAHCSAELGVLFATLAILTGPVWAKEEWGVYWRWDDTKLVTTFVLWLVYIGYLMLRAAVTDPSARARVSAVYGILGFITVPLSLLSSRIAPLLRSSHPQVIASSSGSLSPEAGLTIGLAVVAFTILFVTMLIKRVEIAESEDELEELKRSIGGES